MSEKYSYTIYFDNKIRIREVYYMRCLDCGTENENGAKFCEVCGRPMIRQDGVGSEKKKTNRTALIVVLITIGVVAVGLMLLFLLFMIWLFSDSSGNDAVSCYEYLERELTEAQYTLYDDQKNFIRANEDLFPTEYRNKAENYVDYSLNYKMIAKNPQKYGSSMMELCYVDVIQIEEADIDGVGVVTIMNIMDSDYNSFVCFYIGELASVYEGDVVDIIGLPLDTSSYNNVSGGATNCVVVATSYVQKRN